MARKKMSNYELDVHTNTIMLHSLIIDDNYVHGYCDVLGQLARSRTFSRKDFDSTVYSIAWAHNIDITRIDVSGVYEMVLEPELG